VAVPHDTSADLSELALAASAIRGLRTGHSPDPYNLEQYGCYTDIIQTFFLEYVAGGVHEVEKLWRDLRHVAPALVKAVEGKALPLTSLAALLCEPEETLEWVVDGRLPAGGFSLLAGKPKAGKNTLARRLVWRLHRVGPSWGARRRKAR
jgi:hypothetical protein